MNELVRDPVWQFVGALIALVATVITVWIYWAQHKRKILSYEILSCEPVVSITNEIEGKLRILFKGKRVTKVYIVIIKLSNLGNTPITSSDFEKPISFTFHSGAKILTAEITDTSPKSLSPKITLDNTSINLEPVLLNSSDYVKIQVLISEFDPKGEFNIGGRIIGVKHINLNTAFSSLNITALTISVALMLVGYLISITAPSSPGVISSIEILGLVVFIFGLVIYSLVIWQTGQVQGFIKTLFKIQNP